MHKLTMVFIMNLIFWGVSKEIGISEWTVQYEFCGLPFYSLKIFFKQWSLLPSLLWITCAAHCGKNPFFVQKSNWLICGSWGYLRPFRSIEATEVIWKNCLKRKKMDKNFCFGTVCAGLWNSVHLTFDSRYFSTYALMGT